MTGTTNNHAAVAYDDRSAGEAKHRGIMDDVSAQLQRLQLITVEVRRLFHNPELFPSEALRARFAAIVASDANLQFVQAVKHLLLRDANVSMIRFNRVNFTRRSYETGSKGWENFYFNMAPGAPTDKDTQEDRLQTSPQSSWQLIPIAGMRVIGDLVNEERILLQWIKDTSLPVAVQPALTTRILDLDKPEEQDPNPKNHLRQVTEEVHARPNPYYEDLKLRLDLPSHAPEPLEDFTPFHHRDADMSLMMLTGHSLVEYDYEFKLGSAYPNPTAFKDKNLQQFDKDHKVIRETLGVDREEAIEALGDEAAVAFDDKDEEDTWRTEPQNILWMFE
ncbi:hypothetical protein LTR40_002778 [Exophiala xenobiotica]|nr:hypothetical protein LTR40_002778 [Exophiala xenobiotica]